MSTQPSPVDFPCTTKPIALVTVLAATVDFKLIQPLQIHLITQLGPDLEYRAVTARTVAVLHVKLAPSRVNGQNGTGSHGLARPGWVRDGFKRGRRVLTSTIGSGGAIEAPSRLLRRGICVARAENMNGKARGKFRS